MNKITKKWLILAIFLLLIVTGVFNMPNLAYANHTPIHTISELQAQIAVLQAKLNVLTAIQKGATPALADCGFTRSLFLGISGNDVKCLQKYLNSAGFLIASSGLGSPGNETGFFGNLTKNALVRWQNANSVVPASGFFGSISRVKYNNVFAVTPPSSHFNEVGGTLEGTELPVISEFTVAASSNQPRSGLAPQGAARVPFTRIEFSAPSTKDVTVQSLTVELRGFIDSAAFDGIILIDDQNGIQIGLAKTLNANKQVVLNEPFTIKAGTTRTFTIAANMGLSLASYQGQLAQLALVAVNAGTTSVKGVMPIIGNEMTVNSTLVIGTASMSRGSLDPGSSQTKDVDTKGLTFAAVRLTTGSQEDITLESVRWNQTGSITSSDLANVVIVAGETEFPASVSSDGRYYYAKFGSGINISKGSSKEIAIKSDIISGSNRTVNFDLLRKTDLVLRGNTFNYYLTPSGGSSGAAAEGSFSSDQEPFYNGYTVTISRGSLRVEKSNAVASASVAKGVSNTPLGAFLFEAKGEGAQISKLIINIATTGTGSASDISNVSIFDEKDAIVAGPKDTSSGSVTFTDAWTIPLNAHVYTVKAKLSNNFATNDTITLSITPSAITAKGELTGLTLTPTPSTSVSSNTQTVKSASLSISVSPIPSQQTVVSGVSGFNIAKYQLDASASGEDIRITSFKLRDTYAGSPGTTDLFGCQLFDGAIALQTGSNVVNPVLDGTSPDDITFTLDSGLVVPSGTVKNADLKCTVSASAVSGSSHSWGINSGVSGNATAVGKNTGVTVTPSVTTAIGQTMTVATQGTITVSLDSSSPAERFGLATATDVLITNLKIEAGSEAIKLEKIGLVLSASTATSADIPRVTLWDGAIKVGEAVFTGSNTTVTANLTGEFIIPKDSSKILIVKADLAQVGTNQPGTTGHLIAVNYDGASTTATQAIGQSSGKTLNPTSGANTAGKGVRLVKSMPVLERLSVPSNTLANGDQILFRFKVTADPKGDVGLYKFTFKTATSGGVSLANFSAYGYSDDSLSSQAYAKNPLNTTPIASADGSGFVEIYFNPVSGGSNEAVSIPLGSTRYYELRGTVSGATSGATASVSLEGDASYLASGYTNTATNVDSDTNNDFIWSPNTTTTATPATSDWINGYLAQGLPSTGLTQQTFSK